MTMETIEHNVKQPAVRAHQTPILLQHGAWHGAWCWQLWMDYFASLGYEVHSFSLPAHGKSSCNKGHINSYTFADYVETLASQIEAISPKPVVVGHSLGGAILQKYLENHQLPGAVLLASVPSTGTFRMGERISRRHPIPMLAAALKLSFYELVRTPKLAQALFLDPKTEVDIVAFQKQLVSETTDMVRSLMFPFAKVNLRKSPIFVIAAEKDTFFTVHEERKTAAKYGAKIVVIDGQAHNLMMESAWKQVANIIDHWITHELALP